VDKGSYRHQVEAFVVNAEPPNTALEPADELERIKTALGAAGDVAYVWDLARDKITWLGRPETIFGFSAAKRAVSGGGFHRCINPEDLLTRSRLLSQHVREGVVFDCEYRVRADDGEVTWVHERGSVTLSAEGVPERLSGVLRPITARKQNEFRLEYQANYDGLTGHYNRNRLREALDQAVAYSERCGVKGAYFVVGIDQLAMITDAFDARSSDMVILTVGRRLDTFLRSSDIIGRVGTNRFGIVISDCSEADFDAVAEKILALVNREPVITPSGPLHVTASIGGVVFPELGQTAYDIMAKADLCLDQARAHGKRVMRYQYSEAHRRDRRKHVAMVEQVQHALRDNRLIFAYQPIVRATTREVVFHEALLRMKTQDGGVIAAGAFMPMIEKLGLTREVDRYVLETAVETLARHPALQLAINVSALTASDRSWLRLLIALLRGQSQVAERMTVEITETVALQDIDESAHFVAKVRDLGCRVALDDFGAGYTTFRHLKALDVDKVKIDGSFVRGLPENLHNQLFIQSLLGLAKGLKIETVAECVENEGEAKVLTDHGVAYLQGYHFGRPDIAPAWLQPAAGRNADAASLRLA
jgi:diguanylate cyclase (GGDEF)-like protein